MYIYIYRYISVGAATTEAVAVKDLYTALGAAAAAPVGTTTERYAPGHWGVHLPGCVYTQLLP